MKILHTADWHLRDKDIEECEKCLNFLVDTAKAEAVGMVVIAGDIFDSQDVKMDSRAAKLVALKISELADICPVAMVIGTPSHDGNAPEVLRHVQGKRPIHVASTPTQLLLYGGKFYPTVSDGYSPSLGGFTPDAVLSLIPQPTKQFFQTQAGIADSDKEIGAAMSALFAGFGAQAEQYHAPHVLVGHWNVSGSALSNGQTLVGLDIEISVDQMMLAQPELICLGHIHKSQKLGICAFYPGSLYHQSWGEMENKGFFIHEVQEDILDSSVFVETPTKKLTRFNHDFTNGSTQEEIRPESVTGSYVRIDYKVWQDEAGTIDKEAITERLKAAGALDVDIRLVRIPRQNVRSEAVLKTEHLRDKIQKMAELKGEEVEWSVLMKAESLEGRASEELIEAVGRAA